MFKHSIMKYLFFVIVIMGTINFSFGSIARANTQIKETCNFRLGDNDSRNDAKQYNLQLCKLKVLEKAGSYIQSRFQITNGQLSREQITSYAAAELSVEILNEVFSLDGKGMVLATTLRATFDEARVRKTLQAIAQNKPSQDALNRQLTEIKNIFGELKRIRKELKDSAPNQARKLRKRQHDKFSAIDDIEAKRRAIISNMRRKANDVVTMIEIGMTDNEIISLVGRPKKIASCSDLTNFFYGPVAIHLSAGMSQCIFYTKFYSRCRSQCSSSERRKKHVIK